MLCPPPVQFPPPAKYLQGLTPCETKTFLFQRRSQYFQEGISRGDVNYKGKLGWFQDFWNAVCVNVIWVQGKTQEVQRISYFLKHQEWYDLQKGVNSPGGWLLVSPPGTVWSQIVLIMFVTLVVDNVVTLVVVTLVGDKIVTVVVDSQNSKS